MIQLSSLPERLRKPLTSLLRAEEQVLYAIDATSPRGLQGKTNEPWAVLTDQVLHLIELQDGHSPKVVTIDRTHLEKVSFAPNKWGITLRFVEKKAIASKPSTQIDFLKEKRTEVNRFCEELWKNVEIEVIKPSVEDASRSAILSAIDLAKITNQPGFETKPDESATHTVISAISGSRADPQSKSVEEWLRILGGPSAPSMPAASPANEEAGRQPTRNQIAAKTLPTEQRSEKAPAADEKPDPNSPQKLREKYAFLGAFLGPMVARLVSYLYKPSGKKDN